MLANQTIVFATEDDRRFVGRSSGIDDAVAESLFNEAPALSDLIDRRSECLTYHHLADNRIAWSRTVYSEQENGDESFEGALTFSVVLEPGQLAGFRHNPALFAFVAQSEGALFLHDDCSSQLGQVELPERTMFEIGRGCLSVGNTGFDRIRRAMEIHHCVAISNVPKPMLFLAGFLSEFAVGDRTKVTFSVGSLFTQSVPRQLLIYPRVTEKIRKFLLDAQVRTMNYADLEASSRVAH